jgi:hypothetical protein
VFTSEWWVVTVRSAAGCDRRPLMAAGGTKVSVFLDALRVRKPVGTDLWSIVEENHDEY